MGLVEKIIDRFPRARKVYASRRGVDSCQEIKKVKGVNIFTPEAISARVDELKDEASRADWGYVNTCFHYSRFSGNRVFAEEQAAHIDGKLVALSTIFCPCEGTVMESERPVSHNSIYRDGSTIYIGEYITGENELTRRYTIGFRIGRLGKTVHPEEASLDQQLQVARVLGVKVKN